MALGWVDWGNVPSWVGSIGSSFALVVTVWTVRDQLRKRAEDDRADREEKARRRMAQARRIDVTAEWTYRSSERDKAHRGFTVRVINDSDDTIRHVRVRVGVTDGGWTLAGLSRRGGPAPVTMTEFGVGVTDGTRLSGRETTELGFLFVNPDPPREEGNDGQRPGRVIFDPEQALPRVAVTFQDAEGVPWRLSDSGALLEEPLPE